MVEVIRDWWEWFSPPLHSIYHTENRYQRLALQLLPDGSPQDWPAHFEETFVFVNGKLKPVVSFSSLCWNYEPPLLPTEIITEIKAKPYGIIPDVHMIRLGKERTSFRIGYFTYVRLEPDCSRQEVIYALARRLQYMEKSQAHSELEKLKCMTTCS